MTQKAIETQEIAEIEVLTEEQMETLATELKKLESEAEAIKAEIEARKNALKDQLRIRKTNEVKAGIFTVKLTQYTTKRIDSTLLKKELPKIYADYCKPSIQERFTVKA